LRSTEERLTTATVSANLGLWDWNPKTDHAWFSDQWWTMLGYLSGELEPSGKTWLALLSPKDRDRVTQELLDHVDGRSENYRVEFRMLCKDGSWRWILAQGRVVERDASGDAVRLSGIHVDITASKELEFRLAAARDAAEEAARAKSRFLATMSHEIRTPMNGILGTAALLKEMRLDDEQTEYVETIRESGDALLSIINDVLDFSKVESGGMTIEKTIFSLTRTIEDIRRLMASAANAKKIGFRISMAPDLSPTVVGDGGRLRQVLLNLVGNAIKFTSRGEVDLDVEKCPLDPTGRTIRFKVRDSGIGIDESALSRLFQPFSQADASTTRRFGGTGLGLAISKRLAELMGGTIEVVSAKGIGSRFTLVCPFDAAPTAENAATTKSMPVGQQRRDFNVLVADDNPINRRVAVRILERLGCRAETAETGAEAIKKHILGKFDLILMDWHMPEIDGVEATRRIRRLDRRADVPIIAMTANAMPGDREQCLESGMNDCLTKPVKPDEVAAMIDRWVGPPPSDSSPQIDETPTGRAAI
jgi:two-component system sensor histidine kinase/response regulator